MMAGMNNHGFRLFGFFFMLVALAVLPVRGENATNNYTGEIWALADAKAALTAAGEITPAKFPDSDTATVEEKMERVYRADGTGEKVPMPAELSDRDWRADPGDGLRPMKALRAGWTPEP